MLFVCHWPKHCSWNSLVVREISNEGTWGLIHAWFKILILITRYTKNNVTTQLKHHKATSLKNRLIGTYNKEQMMRYTPFITVRSKQDHPHTTDKFLNQQEATDQVLVNGTHFFYQPSCKMWEDIYYTYACHGTHKYQRHQLQFSIQGWEQK